MLAKLTSARFWRTILAWLHVQLHNVICRPLIRRMAPPPRAGIMRRRRRRKTDAAPPSQPKLSAAAAAEIFTAHRDAVMIIIVKLAILMHFNLQQQSVNSTVPYSYSLLQTSLLESWREAPRKIWLLTYSTLYLTLSASNFNKQTCLNFKHFCITLRVGFCARQHIC